MKKIFLVLTLLVSGFGFAESWLLECRYILNSGEEAKNSMCVGYCDNKLYVNKDKMTVRWNMTPAMKISKWSDARLSFFQDTNFSEKGNSSTVENIVDFRSMENYRTSYICPNQDSLKEIIDGIRLKDIDKDCEIDRRGTSDQNCRIIEYKE